MTASSSGLPSELDLVIGDSFRAPITGAGSQGYRWLATIDGDADAVEVDTVGVPPAGGQQGQGSYPRELRVEGLRAGTATVRLALTHAGGAVREEHVIVVRVHDATT
jgi:hypothetical protein